MTGPLSALDSSSRRRYAALLANFAFFGLSMTLVGATLPRLIREYGWSYTTSGAVVASSSLGYFLATAVVGFSIHRIGARRALVAGLAIEAVGFVLFGRSPSAAIAMLLNFSIGLGQGCVEMVTNYGVIRIERPGESRLMNLLHAAFCVGGVLGPLGAGAFLSATAGGVVDWRLVYLATGVVAALASLALSRMRFPAEEEPVASVDAASAVGAAPGARSIHLSPILAVFALMLLVYVSGEIGFSNWASEYFVDRLKAPPATGALMVSVLWLGILAGRLGLSFWFKGDRQDIAIIALAVLSTVAVLLLRSAPTVPMAALAVLFAGLGYSGVYPMVMTLVGRRFPSGRAVGIAATGGGIGSFAFPFLMGYVGERVGMDGSFLMCAAASAVLALLAVSVLPRRNRNR